MRPVNVTRMLKPCYGCRQFRCELGLVAHNRILQIISSDFPAALARNARLNSDSMWLRTLTADHAGRHNMMQHLPLKDMLRKCGYAMWSSGLF